MSPKSTAIFIDMKVGITFTVLQQKYKLNTLASYYVVKAHKLANAPHFAQYWGNGQDKEPLKEVLRALYNEDTLPYCHTIKDALPEVEDYVFLAQQVL